MVEDHHVEQYTEFQNERRPLSTDAKESREDIKAVLLVGGLGTRLRSIVPSTPKALASVGTSLFLELLVRQLRSQGIRRLVMCTGYLGDQIENAFGDGQSWGVDVEYSRELSPLGTAGAIKQAQAYLQDSPNFLVMNGDSFLEVDLRRLIRFHCMHGGLASLAVVQVKDAGRYGTVQMNGNGRVHSFLEKTGSDDFGMVNAGIYVFDRAVLDHIPDGPAGLEREVFPRLLRHGVYALEQHGLFIDIGTPDDYARAQVLHDTLYKTSLEKEWRRDLEAE